MPEKKRIQLEFPLGGRNDRFGYQKQPPYTTLAARNVWPNATYRARGGSRPGVSRIFGGYDLGGSIFGLSQVSYIPTASSRIKTVLVALVVDALYSLDSGGNLTGPHNIVTGGTSEMISMAERSQKLYIANHAISQNESATNCQPLIYDPLTDAVTTWTATDGTLPLGCSAIALFRDRMVLAGGTTDPYGVFMSRQGDPLDWDYSELDVGAAVNLSLTTAGQMPDTVTSLTPHADNCLIMGCPTSLWMLVGDPGPGGGGQLVNLSQTVGVVDRNACCTTPDGLFVFLSADGLYMIPAGCASSGNPISISREKIPAELLNIERASTSTGKIVSLAYDVRWRGVHIFVSDRTSGETDEGNSHWFFDWEHKAFWEVQFGQAGFDPWHAIAWKNRASSESVVVMGCRDGCLRSYVSTAETDDDGESTEAEIESSLVIGPIVEGPEMANEVRLDELDVVLSSDSGHVEWEVYSGNSVEEVATKITDGEERTSGHAGPGRNNRYFPRVKGAAILLRIFSRTQWAFESATAAIARLGRVRV